MKKYDQRLIHYLIISTDYENEEKIRNLLDAHDEIEGNYDDKSVVISHCPNCGDDEFWSHGKCSHCGYEID